MDKSAAKYHPEMLLEIAIAIRLTIQGAIEDRKAEKLGNGILNGFLYEAENRLKRVSDGEEGLRLEGQWDQRRRKRFSGH